MAATSPITSQPDSPEARRYNRIKRWLGIADFAVGFGLLIILLVSGWTGNLRDFAYHLGRQYYTVSLVFYVVMLMLLTKVIGIGLEYYGFRLEHNYHLSNQKLGSWLWDQVKGFLVSVILASIVAVVLYSILREYALHWWLLSWAVFLGLFILMAQIAPVVLFPIFYKFEPLQNDDLKARLVRLSEKAGTRVRGVYKWRLSEKSNKANAALTGLGATRRIILADTLLDNYSPEEIEAVLAHELGHHVHKHILKSIGVQAIVTLIGFWAANLVLHIAVDRWHMFETLSDFANIPLLILVATLLSLLLMPALNAYSRFNERQADRYAFRSISTISPFISSMNKLASQNLAERTPSKLVEWLFHSHPSISRRVEAAEAWSLKTTH
jgi:STE24 endopeptidase